MNKIKSLTEALKVARDALEGAKGYIDRELDYEERLEKENNIKTALTRIDELIKEGD
jgi:RecA/RadA recombinase